MNKNTANRITVGILAYAVTFLLLGYATASFINTAQERTDYIISYEGQPYPVLDTIINGDTLGTPSLTIDGVEEEIHIPDGKDLNIATVQVAMEATRLQVLQAQFLQRDADAESLRSLFFEQGGTEEQWEEFQLERLNQDFNQRIEEEFDAAKQQLQTSAVAAYSAVRNYLNEPTDFSIRIAGVMKDTPAEEAGLEAGDLITAVNGEKQSIISLADYLQTIPDTTLNYTIQREGETFTVPVTAEPNPAAGGKRLIGIFGSDEYNVDGEITFAYGQVGGASAGLIFSIGIYELLTEEDILLTDVKYGGTGSITPDGKVLEVDGLKQKLIAAENTQHDYFFIPTEMCEEANSVNISKTAIVPVGTFSEAVEMLELIRNDKVDELATCQ